MYIKGYSHTEPNFNSLCFLTRCSLIWEWGKMNDTIKHSCCFNLTLGIRVYRGHSKRNLKLLKITQVCCLLFPLLVCVFSVAHTIHCERWMKTHGWREGLISQWTTLWLPPHPIFSIWKVFWNKILKTPRAKCSLGVNASNLAGHG